ncbi:MAG TPA: hypothetical protein DFS52_31575 [Myxococcales bacterium]|jgi:hypothetical protein|nr:hypothetical protein [Myxococcales bacterium]
MQRKSTVRGTVEVTEVSEAIDKARTLASEEEKVLRMRHGSKVATQKPLERHGEGNQELQDELLLMEMQLLRAYRQHQKQMARAAAPAPSRTKDKIVRALRKKR